tara:strand:- start:46 stop:486 length:441 start_codon:yes stop_codon:yes gene_type:complete
MQAMHSNNLLTFEEIIEDDNLLIDHYLRIKNFDSKTSFLLTLYYISSKPLQKRIIEIIPNFLNPFACVIGMWQDFYKPSEIEFANNWSTDEITLIKSFESDFRKMYKNHSKHYPKSVDDLFSKSDFNRLAENAGILVLKLTKAASI